MTKRKIVITLPENPSTGFVWDVKEIGIGNEVRVAGNDFAPYEQETRDGDIIVGAGGTRSFTLECPTKDAKGKVQFELHRPWDNEAAIQVVTMEVQ